MIRQIIIRPRFTVSSLTFLMPAVINVMLTISERMIIIAVTIISVVSVKYSAKIELNAHTALATAEHMMKAFFSLLGDVFFLP